MHRAAAKFVPRILRVSLFTQQFLAKTKMAIIPYPPYFPDLAPCEFFLFSKLKLKLKGQRLNTIEDIQAEPQTVLNTDIKPLPGNVPKMEKTVGPMSTCGRKLLRG
jgi:hypothetical protein